MALTLPYPDLVFVPLDILTAEEQNEIVANYTYIANQFPIGANNIDFATYSTTEQVVGKWVDGKTIYRKVVTYNNLPVLIGAGGVTVGNLGTNIDKIISINGCGNGETDFLPIGWTGTFRETPSDWLDIFVAKNTGEITARNRTSETISQLIMVFEYTKQ